MGIKLIIQIAAFNEEENIAAALEDIPSFIEDINFIETIVIDDGSKDKTVQMAKEHRVKHIISLPHHVGLGRAFREGLRYACSIGADIIVNTDSDAQYRGNEIQKIIRPILNGKTDVVIGNRQLNKISGYPLYKLISQLIGNFVVSTLFHAKIEDTTSGFRALAKDSAEILIDELKNDYTYSLESICILLKKKRRISFVPVNIRYPTRESRLITNKLFYVKNFFATLFRCFLTDGDGSC